MSAPVPQLLYMLDCVIDDLVITRPNHCAPEEYSTCVEITFRSNVRVNVCDREFGQCVKMDQPKVGKCNIFPLDSPVTKDDRLLVHVYKKRSDCCKFLIGMSSMEIKPLFDKVDKLFNEYNVDWAERCQENLANLPRMKGTHRDQLDTCNCYKAGYERHEQLCPSSATTKVMLPLFNACQQQTGNMVLILRLLCHGPSIVSVSYQMGQRLLPAPRVAKDHPCSPSANERAAVRRTVGLRYFAGDDICEDAFDRNCPTRPRTKH